MNDIFQDIIDDFFPAVSQKEIDLDNSPVFPEDKEALNDERNTTTNT